MKQFLLFFAFVFIFVISVFNKITVTDNYTNRSDLATTPIQNYCFPNSPISNNENTHESESSGGMNVSLKGMAVSTIRNEEYNISYSEDLKSYQSPNRANNIRFIYHNDGFTAKTRDNKIPLFDIADKRLRPEEKKFKEIPEWELKLRVNGYSKDIDHENLFSGGIMKVDKNRSYVEDGNLRLEYTNDERGMRQDFIVMKKPSGNDRLRINLEATTNLNISIDKESVTFTDNSGNEMMKYSSLKVWDANGKELRAGFEKINEITDTKLFAITVNEDNAVYPITVDPISTSPNWIAEINQPDAGFGFSVSYAGDVNNDGYDDVIVGAPYYDNGQTNEGRAFVYLGSNIGLLPVAIWTTESNQDYAQLGWSVSAAGDVNNDGYDDVIVGADSYSNDQAYEGRAYVHFGSAIGLSAVPNKILESNQANAKFGYSVSCAGDINNDGYSDIIVGAPLFDNGQTDEGRIFIYYGSATGPSLTANTTSESNQANAFFGNAVSRAGDVNGDGFDDLIIGANVFDNPQRDQGCGFIYYGSPTGIPTTANWKNSSINEWFSYLGVSICAAGDVNGDGYDDIIAGATGFDSPAYQDEGKVFVYYGSALGPTLNADWTAENSQAFSRFGNSVSTAGDVNNDGYDDIIVGSYLYENGQEDEGKAYIYFGSSVGLTSPAFWSTEINQAGACFGNSVSSAGDVNGDGYSDVIVGAYLYDNGQANEGRAYVYYGASGGPKVLDLNVVIEGLYNNVTNTSLTDSISVNLRSSVPPYAIADVSKTKINTSGKGIYSFNSASNGVGYFIEVRHKNSITTWSAVPQFFTNNFKTYDFRTASSKAFGNNMIRVDDSPVTYAIYSGDVNLDEHVELEDMLIVYNDANNFITGNSVTDLNGDLVVDLNDLIFTSNNSSNFVHVAHP